MSHFIWRRLPNCVVGFMAFSAAWAVSLSPSWGAEPANLAKEAITSLSDAGVDYFLTGEYMGDIKGELVQTAPCGLHVVCQSEGDFTGRLYMGGLPGTGWDGEKPVLLKGSLESDQVTLTGGDWSVFVAQNQAMLRYKGSSAGELKKVIRHGKTLGLKPPAGAIVLFDGEDNGELVKPKINDGLLQIGTETTRKVGAFRLHVEFRTPYMPKYTGQARGNSGIYIQKRYEIQILDSFGLEGIENECGSIYRQRRPDVNMALPPLQWQTYDIYFQPPVFDADNNKTKNAVISVIHNGVPVQYENTIIAKTGAGEKEGPEPLPIKFQDHGDPVVFRNVWIKMQ